MIEMSGVMERRWASGVPPGAGVNEGGCTHAGSATPEPPAGQARARKRTPPEARPRARRDTPTEWLRPYERQGVTAPTVAQRASVVRSMSSARAATPVPTSLRSDGSSFTRSSSYSTASRGANASLAALPRSDGPSNCASFTSSASFGEE